MQNDTSESSHLSLAETLEQTLAGDQEKGPSIGELTSAVGDKGFGLLLMILSLPSALPVPAPGYSIPFGVAMALIAVQIFIGREHLSLPKKVNSIRIPAKLASKMVGSGAKFLRKIETLIKPRQQWMHSQAGHATLAVVIFIMATFMMIPIPGTNTMPAMAIFIIGVSMAEEDGLIAIGAVLAAILAATISGIILYLAITQGPEAVETFKDWIKGLLGMSEG